MSSHLLDTVSVDSHNHCSLTYSVHSKSRRRYSRPYSNQNRAAVQSIVPYLATSVRFHQPSRSNSTAKDPARCRVFADVEKGKTVYMSHGRPITSHSGILLQRELGLFAVSRRCVGETTLVRAGIADLSGLASLLATAFYLLQPCSASIPQLYRSRLSLSVDH